MKNRKGSEYTQRNGRGRKMRAEKRIFNGCQVLFKKKKATSVTKRDSEYS